MIILAGDIGGTRARFGLFAVEGYQFTPLVREVYPCREFTSLEDIVRQFRSSHGEPIAAATLGIAGPVRDGRVVTPNLPWTVSAEPLAQVVGTARLQLINDLEANAFGAAALSPTDFAVLQAGVEDPTGHACILSAGTGLGQAGFYFDGRFRRPFPSEGGHADFAPQTDQEIELFRFLRQRFGHVSYERVLSGPGLVNIFEFLRSTHQGEEPEELTQELAGEAPTHSGAGAISRAALAGTSSRAERALDLFVTVYGAAAGNLAMTFKATAGVYLGGGIAPQILKRLDGDLFRNAFLDKGRMRPLLEQITVRVILNDQCALLGAALHAGLSIGQLTDRWAR